MNHLHRYTNEISICVFNNFLLCVYLPRLWGGATGGADCYEKTVLSGMGSLKWASQIEKWYGPQDVDHFITHFGFDKNKPRTWNSVAYLHGRYILTVQIPVDINYKKCSVIRVAGKPKIDLAEIKSIEILPGEKVSTRYHDGAACSEDDWALLEDAGGDLKVLPLNIEKSDPHPLFDQYREAWGRDIIRPK